MCGIAGYIGSQDIDAGRVLACLKLMRRRGPDASSAKHFHTRNGKNVYLLHSRLSIIDRDIRSNQPFEINADQLVFNGELYNYIELRILLRRAGHEFRTQSDTEVLVRQLVTYGINGLDACEGMWAFAWFNSHAQSLTLSRDRFGEKPLYVYRTEHGIWFASEIKYICCLAAQELSVNYNHVYRYLVNGYKSLYKTKETFYQGLSEVPPGHCLIINEDGSVDTRRYWTPAIANCDETISYQDAVNNTHELLAHSIYLRLRADVPVAFCLSGGIDSNALAAIAGQRLNYDVHGFTIVNTDARYEERDMVEAAVRKLNIKHTCVDIDTTHFIDNLGTLIKQHDAPVYTITYYAQWRLMQAIAEAGYKVSVSGTGADELFSGYYDHHNAYLYELRHDTECYQQALRNWKTVVAPLVRNPLLRNPECFINNPQQREHIYLDAHNFAQFLQQDWHEAFSEQHYCDSLLRNRMANELFHESVPAILHEDDLNAMYYSVENRSPFLDRQLFEYCQRIPTRHLIKDGKAKSVLRDSVRHQAAPQVIDNPRKVGFNVPIYDYLNINDKQVRDYLLDDSIIFDYIRRDKIEDLINRPHLPNSQSKFLFYFLNCKLFLEQLQAG